MPRRAIPTLLIVDDDPLISDSLSFALSDDFDIRVENSRTAAMALLRSGDFSPDLALIDLGLPPVPDQPTEGFKLVSDLLAWSGDIRIFVLSGQNETSNARRARALGALDLVPKPCAPEQLRKILRDGLKVDAAERAQDTDGAQGLIGDSPAMRKLKGQIDLYAASVFPTLIEGESGSGKERVASALHELSPRSHLPFLALNCAAISANLVEATLFGHAKGAFTGAANAKAGYFEEAGEGTLFLDEIGELPLELQPKLLRVLENGDFQRIGETASRKSKARIVAATNRDLRAEVKAGRFRSDLYHRLSVFSISMPSLRELGDDKLKLMEHFCTQTVRSHGTPAFTLDAEARALWLSYGFPGNVRELKNVVIRLLAKHSGYVVGKQELAQEFASDSVEGSTPVGARGFDPADEISANPNFNLATRLSEIELQFLDAAIAHASGNMSQAARILGMSRSTLYSRVEALRPGSTKPDERV